MLGPIWSDFGHLGLPDLVVSTFMDVSNSYVDGRADNLSDSRLESFTFRAIRDAFEFEPLHSNG